MSNSKVMLCYHDLNYSFNDLRIIINGPNMGNDRMRRSDQRNVCIVMISIAMYKEICSNTDIVEKFEQE